MIHKLFLVFSLLVLSSTSAISQTVTQLNPNGSNATIKLLANSKASQTAYVISRGNESQYITFRVQAPIGTRVSAQSIVLGNAKPLDLISRSAGWINSSFVSSTGSETQTLSVGLTLQSRAATSVPPVKLASSGGIYCGNFTASDLDQIIAALQPISSVTYTRNYLCQIYGYRPGTAYQPDDGVSGFVPDNSPGDWNSVLPPNTGVVSGSQAYVTTQIFVRKDTCGVKSNGAYLVKIDFNFDRVSDDRLTQDSEITLSALPIVYRGSKASSIKPESDGKFAPKALFLMATTGGFSWGSDQGSEKINVVRWSRRGLSSTTIKVEDMVYWRGHQLARAVAEPVLRGGRGTVELQSRVGTYSVCFNLVKSRQRLNGYK